MFAARGGMKMNKVFGHFKLITRHKWKVFKLSCIAGIPLRGFLHDFSKYHPTEFIEGARYFNGVSSPIDEAKKVHGYSKAWFHHRALNKHHWEYWIDNIEDGCTPVLMPYEYAVEMMCDLIGAGQIYEGDSWDFNRPYDWFKERTKRREKIHPEIVSFIDNVLLEMKMDGNYNALKPQNTKLLYYILTKNDA